MWQGDVQSVVHFFISARLYCCLQILLMSLYVIDLISLGLTGIEVTLPSFLNMPPASSSHSNCEI